jgi:hypothetical protein
MRIHTKGMSEDRSELRSVAGETESFGVLRSSKVPGCFN